MQLQYYYEQATSYVDYHDYSPGPRHLGYLALGLAGEAGEFVDKVKKVLRDHNAKLSEENLPLLVKELGDVLWYLACCCHELEYRFYMLTERPISSDDQPIYLHSFDAFQKASQHSMSPSNMNLLHEALRMYKDAALVGEAYMGLTSTPAGEDRMPLQWKIQQSMRNIMLQLAICSVIMRVELEDVARINLEKIADRAARGTLGGKGDER